jgi:uncharacterized protein (DUF1499 family)
MACNIGLAWTNISSMTIKNCWPKCISATDDNIKHKEQLLGFTEDVAEASSTLNDILQVNNL